MTDFEAGRVLETESRFKITFLTPATFVGLDGRVITVSKNDTYSVDLPVRMEVTT